jgi:peptidoglycan hydrolase-like protein with peptidoglycan-binding domain
MSSSPSISRSKRQTSAAAAVAAALAVLAWACAAPAAQAAGGRGTDADIPGMTALRSKAADEVGVYVLRQGAGYASRLGSPTVRELQRTLRRLGQHPGPIDGLYGPLTQAAVERFQLAHGLVIDGIVGPRTGRSLARHLEAQRKRAETATAHGSDGIGAPDAASAPAGGHTQANVEGSTEALSPEWAALIAGLALALLLTALSTVRSRRRERAAPAESDNGLNPGLALACLLAVLVIGAAGGAVFASQASPDVRTDTTADGLGDGSQPLLAPARLRETVATPGEAHQRFRRSEERAPR